MDENDLSHAQIEVLKLLSGSYRSTREILDRLFPGTPASSAWMVDAFMALLVNRRVVNRLPDGQWGITSTGWDALSVETTSPAMPESEYWDYEGGRLRPPTRLS